MGRLRLSKQYIQGQHHEMSQALRFGDLLEYFPRMLEGCIDSKWWAKLETVTLGRPFKSVVEYVTYPEPDGLNCAVETITELVSGSDVEGKWRAEVTANKGAQPGNTNNRFSRRKKRKSTNSDIITIRTPERGTSRSYMMERLQKQKPKLYKKVVDGKMSCNAAAVEAGFRRASPSVTSIQGHITKLTDDEYFELIEWLKTDGARRKPRRKRNGSAAVKSGVGAGVSR